MHAFWVRGNALLTNFLVVAAVMAILTSCTDFMTVPKLPEVNIKMKSLEFLKRSRQGDDQALLRLDLKADLRPFWTWNTKLMFVYLQAEYVTGRNQLNQVSLLDNIILSKKRVNLKWDVKQEYPFVDQGAFLRGRPVNLTLTWSIMPKVGALRQYSRTVPIGELPKDYTDMPQRWGSWKEESSDASV